MSLKVSTTASPARDLQATRIVFISIVGCVILFLLAALVIVEYRGPLLLTWEPYGDITVWVMAAISLGCLLLAKRLFNKSIAVAKNSLNPVLDKLSRYRRALLVYLAICELAAILNIVLFIFTNNFVFLAFAAVLLGFMLAMMPARRRVVAALELDALQEKEL